MRKLATPLVAFSHVSLFDYTISSWSISRWCRPGWHHWCDISHSPYLTGNKGWLYREFSLSANFAHSEENISWKNTNDGAGTKLRDRMLLNRRRNCSSFYSRLVCASSESTGLSFRNFYTNKEISAYLFTSPHLTPPHLTSPHFTSPHFTSPHIASPHLTGDAVTR